MLQKRILFSSGLLLSSLLLGLQAEAKQNYPSAQPTTYKNAIYCFECHNASSVAAAGENNATKPYGLLFGNLRSGNLTSTYIALEPFDVDGDGFSNIQEIKGSSNFNTRTSTPQLVGTNKVVSGSKVVTAQPLVNETISQLKQTPSQPANLPLVAGEKNIGGTINLTMNSLTLNVGTPTFMFSTGGVQTGGKAYFINNSGVATLIPATVNNNGSITLALTDEGPYDLYTQASYIATAKTRAPSVDATATISPYATVDATAVISPYVTINDYATVGAYALIGANATVDTYATVDNYAIVDAYTTVAANTTQAAPTNYLGTIKSKIAVVTTTPTIPIGFGGGEGGEGGGTTGGLHCMTTGLGLQGLMFFGLFAAGYMLRRKRT